MHHNVIFVFQTKRSWDHDVVIVRRVINLGVLGIWNGEGMGREWGGVKKGEVSLRVTINRREAKGNQQGESRKQGDCAIMLVNLYTCTY